eukprot:594347-Amphidinium_carterae.1
MKLPGTSQRVPTISTFQNIGIKHPLANPERILRASALQFDHSKSLQITRSPAPDIHSLPHHPIASSFPEQRTHDIRIVISAFVHLLFPNARVYPYPSPIPRSPK